MTVPTLTLNNQTQIPQLGFGVFQIPPEQTADAVTQAFGSATGTSTPPRCTATSRRSARPSPPPASRAASCGSRASSTTGSTAPTTPAAPSTRRWRSWASTTSTCSSSTGRCRRCTTATTCRPGAPSPSSPPTVAPVRSASPTSSPTTSTGSSAETGVVPVVNQIEVHPYFANEAARGATHRHGAVVESWSPIAQGAVLSDATVGGIAAAHERTASQVTLRWHVQRGDIVFPKTVNRARMEENFGIFDFELTDDEMSRDHRARPRRARPPRPEPGDVRHGSRLRSVRPRASGPTSPAGRRGGCGRRR